MENITIGEIFEFLKLLAGIMTTVGTISVILLKNVKKHIDNNVKEALKPLIKNIEINITGLQCSMRNDILLVYMMRKKDKKFSIQEKQAINYSYELYSKIGGNSFVKDIVEEMNTWEVTD